MQVLRTVLGRGGIMVDPLGLPTLRPGKPLLATVARLTILASREQSEEEVKGKYRTRVIVL
jgi:hypothetical protein